MFKSNMIEEKWPGAEEFVDLFLGSYIFGDMELRSPKTKRKEYSLLEPSNIKLDESFGVRRKYLKKEHESRINAKTLEVICDKLCLKEQWPKEFEGMYVKNGKIVVDRHKDTKKQLNEFLFVKCRDIFAQEGVENPEEIVQFIEQNEKAKCVGKGTDRESDHSTQSHKRTVTATRVVTDLRGSNMQENSRIELLANELCLRTDWPKEVIGIRVKEDKIVIDCQESTDKRVKHFVNVSCVELFARHGFDPAEIIQYSDRSMHSSYLVKRGGTIFCAQSVDNAKEIVRQNRSGQPINELLQAHRIAYGTVAGIGKQATRRYYLITAHHVFEADPDRCGDFGNEVNLPFLCENDDNLDYIANQGHGVFGGNGPNRKAVDINVIPINSFPPENQPGNNHSRVTIFKDDPQALSMQTVERYGATMHFAYGIICETNYRTRLGDRPCTEFLVVTTDPKHKPAMFSQRGDSGSLVIRRKANSIEAIGIISKGTDSWENTDGQIVPATFVVLLKNCLEAIKSKFDIDLELDANWESIEAIALAQ